MKREELSELHYITAIENIRSIIAQGILSNRRATRVAHRSVAMERMQERRRPKRVTSKRTLHDYVCLYFSARNPMMSKVRDLHTDLCVLRINPDVIDLPGVVVTDRNAAANWVRFDAPSVGLPRLDASLVFAEWWTHEDPREYQRRKSIKCAEVLVPDRIDPGYIVGAYVSCVESRRGMNQLAPGLPTDVDPHLFFL